MKAPGPTSAHLASPGVSAPEPTSQVRCEEPLIPNSEFRVVDSLWAHFAMFCLTDSEREQIDACIADLLKEKVD